MVCGLSFLLWLALLQTSLAVNVPGPNGTVVTQILSATSSNPEVKVVEDRDLGKILVYPPQPKEFTVEIIARIMYPDDQYLEKISTVMVGGAGVTIESSEIRNSLILATLKVAPGASGGHFSITYENEDNPNHKGCNVRLLPVEIVDKNRNVVAELKVGKMEDAITPSGILDIDKDEDRFFVRISRGAALKNVSIKLGTVENPDGTYNDDATEIDMIVDGNDLITKSLLLVSDDIDDDYAGNGVGADDVKNDRTHKVQLGGKVQIKSITFDGTEHQLDMKTNVPFRKVITIGTLVQSSLVPTTDIEKSFRIAQERFSQVGIKLEHEVSYVTSYPVGVTLHDGFSLIDLRIASADGEIGVLSVAEEAKALVDGISDEYDVRCFYVGEMQIIEADGSLSKLATTLGFAFPKYAIRTADQLYTNSVFINTNFNYGTLAHEIGHILTNNGHYGNRYGVGNTDVSFNMMKISPGEATKVHHAKRLTKQQEILIYE